MPTTHSPWELSQDYRLDNLYLYSKLTIISVSILLLLYSHTRGNTLTFSKKMSLENLTDSIVQLCEECNVWSSTINIPHGNSDILDISAACGSQACTPKGAAMYPEKCPNGLHGSYYTFDPSLYGEHSWPDLKSMLTTPGCVSGCKLVVCYSRGL